jgi:hypothetical protein
MTHEQVAAFRLARHHLAGSSRGSVETLCSAVCGAQAQVMSATELALWTRNHALRKGDVAEALWARRSLVKTSAMRQTLHLLPAQDFGLYISALRRSRMAASERLRVRLEVSPAETSALRRRILAALEDGPETQQALVARVTRGATAGMRVWLKYPWSAFRPLIVDGAICYAQPRGAATVLVRTDQWLGGSPAAIDEHAAKCELLRRFLGSYGPATAHDFAKWSGMPLAEARPVWASIEPETRQVDVEGSPARVLTRDARALAAALGDSDAVRLLPAFDGYLLAHAAKDHMLDPRFYKRVYRNQGWLSPVILHGGRIVATWTLRAEGKSRLVAVSPFERLAAGVRKGIEEEAGALSAFLSAPTRVSFGRD